MFDPRHIALHRELLKEAEDKIAVDPSLLKLLLAGGVGGAAVGVPALIMHQHQKQEAERTRNRAFGAGMATGIAAPKILRGLFNIANGAGLVAPGGPL